MTTALRKNTSSPQKPENLTPAWRAFKAALPLELKTIHTQADYKKTVNFMNGLLDSIGDDESHELIGLLDLVAKLVQEYENEKVVIPDAAPGEVLRFLMAQNGLSQADLADVLGGQSIVSAVLSGKRQINARQAKALAIRFSVAAESFI